MTLPANLASSATSKTFLPALEQRRSRLPLGASRRALFILDGHNSRAGAKFLEAMVQHEVDVIILPAHSSHLLQPLDRTCHGVFKQKLRQLGRENHPRCVLYFNLQKNVTHNSQ
eukprot:TRINITY_DN1026_c0_g2_i26.p3 TRINITY_DN1026_c0_g2~~TRINITY_DN1026_c0_g2_i26.p3  ORF type:complete len:114 (-),score=1.57 TRINITY_DN1026_c0_g2_i26:548-889(-)